MVYGCFANKVLGLCFCFIGVQVTNWVHLHQNDYFFAHEYCWFWIIHLWFQSVCLILEFFHLQGSGPSNMENLLSEKTMWSLCYQWFIFKSRFNCHSYIKWYSILSKEVCNRGVACSLLKLAADKPRPLLQNSLILRWDKILVIVMRFTKASWNHLTTVMSSISIHLLFLRVLCTVI